MKVNSGTIGYAFCYCIRGGVYISRKQFQFILVGLSFDHFFNTLPIRSLGLLEPLQWGKRLSGEHEASTNGLEKSKVLKAPYKAS